jgi:hypothetical protein
VRRHASHDGGGALLILLFVFDLHSSVVFSCFAVGFVVGQLVKMDMCDRGWGGAFRPSLIPTLPHVLRLPPAAMQPFFLRLCVLN